MESDLLERFRLDRVLGSGGLGTVYKAYDCFLDREVALKIFHPHLPGAVANRQQRQEVKLAQRISHPNVIRIHDIVGNGIVMEYIEGGTLAELIRQIGPLSLPHSLELALGIARGLAAAHLEGIVHADLKPANILLNSNGVAKITDFGMASTATQVMSDGCLKGGTALYMSPEQRSGFIVDCRSDVYSFGLILCEMLLGKLPATTSSERLSELKLIPGMRKQFVKLVQVCIEDCPERRATIGEVISRIQSQTPNRWKKTSFQTISLLFVLLVLLTGFYCLHVKARNRIKAPIVITNIKFDSNESLLFRDAFLSAAVRAARSTGRNVWYSENDAPTRIASLVPASATLISGDLHSSTTEIVYELDVRSPKGYRSFKGRAKLSVLSPKLAKLVPAMFDGVTSLEESEGLPYHIARSALLRHRRDSAALVAAEAGMAAELEQPQNESWVATLLELRLALYASSQNREWLNSAQRLLRERTVDLEKPEAAIALAKYYMSIQDTAEATRVLENALEKQPQNVELRRVAGQIALKRGAISEAIRNLEIAVDENPLDWISLTSLGAAYLTVPSIEKAVSTFEAANKLTADPMASSNLGAALLIAGRYSEALPLLEASVATSPSGQGSCNFGQALWYTHHEMLALAAFESGFKREQSELTAGCLAHGYRWAGKTQLAQEMFQSAIRMGKEQLKRQPNDSALLGRIASYDAVLGKRVAIEEIERARSLKYTDLDLLVKHAIVMTVLGETNSARALIQQIVARGAGSMIKQNPEFTFLLSARNPNQIPNRICTLKERQ